MFGWLILVFCVHAATPCTLRTNTLPVADRMLKMAVAHAGGFLEASTARNSASPLQRDLGRQRRLCCLKMPQRTLCCFYFSIPLLSWTKLLKC
jgi:hypothetical protein